MTLMPIEGIVEKGRIRLLHLIGSINVICVIMKI